MAFNQSLRSQLETALIKQFGESDADKFLSIIDDNGFDDDDSIIEDVKDADDSLLRDDDNMTADAFACIQRVCSEYGKALNPFEDLDDPIKMKEWDSQYKVTEDLYMRQCPTLVQSSKDASLKNVATLGRLSRSYGNVPLIAYVVDTFNRFRIEEFLRSNGQADVQSADFLRMLPFYHEFNTQQKSKKNQMIELLTTLESYSARWTNPLDVAPSSVFVDNLDDILCYIFGVSQMVGSLLENSNNPADDDPNLDVELPFQFDLAILPHGGQVDVKKKFTQVDVPGDDDNDDDDDDEAEEKAHRDLVEGQHDIKKGLEKFDIEAVRFEVSQQSLKDNIEGNMRRLKHELKSRFAQLKPQRHGRYVMVVDRRGDTPDEKNAAQSGSKENNDKILMFSPNCPQLPEEKVNPESGPSFHRLHQDYVEESLLYKTLKCLVPSARARMDPHFGCKNNDMITLSFHVLRKDLIKCYLFANGGGARFDTTDLIKVLPSFFSPSSSNSSTLSTRAMVEQNFKLKLQDEQFEAWYKKTTTK